MSEIYHGGRMPAVSWEAAPTAPSRTESEWQEFWQRPWRDHQEYASELKRIVSDYHHIMDRKSKKSQELRQVIRNGALARHYHYMRNNNVFAQMSGVANMLNGTPQNEAEHMTLKRWCHCVWQQHADSPVMISEVFGLVRMITNAIRNQSLGLESLPAGRITHILGGIASAGALRDVDRIDSQPGQRHQEAVGIGGAVGDKRSILRKSVVKEAPTAKAKRLQVMRAKQQAWLKHVGKRPLKTKSRCKAPRRIPSQIRRNVERVVMQSSA